ncbi:MAG: glycosyltransferase [Halobacteria archaeon]
MKIQTLEDGEDTEGREKPQDTAKDSAKDTAELDTVDGPSRKNGDGTGEGGREESTERRKRFGFEDVAVVMATYNEEEAVESVITDVLEATQGEARVVCVDGSSDSTPDIARAMGAEVVRQEPQGYGVAVKEAVLTPERDVVVTTDCDDTYPMEEIPRFLDLINQGHDVVSGDRITGGTPDMPTLNYLGNKIFAGTASVLLEKSFSDVTTGMRAYRRTVLQEIKWTENTGLSAELLLRPSARGYEVREEKIPYSERKGETKLDPIQGGGEIAYSVLKVAAEERFRRIRRRL